MELQYPSPYGFRLSRSLQSMVVTTTFFLLLSSASAMPLSDIPGAADTPPSSSPDLTRVESGTVAENASSETSDPAAQMLVPVAADTPPATPPGLTPVESGVAADEFSSLSSDKAATVADWINSVGYYPPQDDADFAAAQIDPSDLEDPDQDGLDNMEEAWIGTDGKNPDTDGDGVPDGVEVNADQLLGEDPSDPTDPSEIPIQPYQEYFVDNMAETPSVTDDQPLSAINPVTPSGLDTAAAGYENAPPIDASGKLSPVLAELPVAATPVAIQEPQNLNYTPDPLLYRSDDQLAGQGWLPGSIYWNTCQAEYRYTFTNWGTIPQNRRDLHQLGAVVGMQTWLEIARQVMPGHPAQCPDVSRTRFVLNSSGANVTFQYIGNAGGCDTTITSARPDFAAIRMASWSQFWTYLHELGHAVGLNHAGERPPGRDRFGQPLQGGVWTQALAQQYGVYGNPAWSRSRCPLMSYGHQAGWPMPQCAGHPQDELRARAFYAQRVRANQNFDCGELVGCKLHRRTHECVPTIPAGGVEADYEDAFHRPCWPRNQQPTTQNVRYGSWVKESYRCSRQDWRLIVTFVPLTVPNDNPVRGMCFVSIGRTADGQVAEYYRRGVGAYWAPKNPQGEVIPMDQRRRENCGLAADFGEVR